MNYVFMLYFSQINWVFDINPMYGKIVSSKLNENSSLCSSLALILFFHIRICVLDSIRLDFLKIDAGSMELGKRFTSFINTWWICISVSNQQTIVMIDL